MKDGYKYISVFLIALIILANSSIVLSAPPKIPPKDKVPKSEQPTGQLKTRLISQGFDVEYVKKINISPEDRQSTKNYYTKIYNDTKSGKNIAEIGILPFFNGEGIENDPSWYQQGDTFQTGYNTFWAEVDSKGKIRVAPNNDQPEGIKKGEYTSWQPDLYLDGKLILPTGTPNIVTDPINDDYNKNTIQISYQNGNILRRIRILEGKLLERWWIMSNPNASIAVQHNFINQGIIKIGHALDEDDIPLKVEVINDTEILPLSELNNAKYPVQLHATATFYPDSGAGSTSVDGYASRDAGGGGEDWADIITSAGTGYNYVGTKMYMLIRADTTSNKWRYNYRPIILFDTSALPDSAIISSAVLGLYVKSKSDPVTAITPDTNVYAVSPASDTTIAAADYQTVVKGTQFATTISYAAINAGAYNDYTFNASGIAAVDKTGVSKFSILNAEYDASAGTPTWSSDTEHRIDYWTSDKGAGYEPKLVVTYDPPPTVLTLAASSVEETTASLGGNITVSGGNVTIRGSQYDTNSGVPYSSNITESGIFGTGNFTLPATSLSEGTLYYQRAFATNNAGTSYGAEDVFLTKPLEPNTLAIAAPTVPGQLELSWVKGTGSDNTTIVRKIGSYPANRADGTTAYSNTGSNYTDTGLDGDLAYYYRAWSYAGNVTLNQYSDAYDEVIGDPLGKYLVLYINGAETSNSTLTVPMPDNGNDWILSSNSTPYINSYKLIVGGNLVTWYEPNDMISGTVLPDREDGDNPGEFTWGVNPASVNVTLGSLVSTSTPVPGGGLETPTTDILPETESSDWFKEPDVSGTLLTNPLRPLVTILSNTTTLTESQAWILYALALIFLTTVGAAMAVKGHLLVSGIVAAVGFGGAVALTIFPLWALVFVIGAVLGGIVAERSPSL